MPRDHLPCHPRHPESSMGPSPVRHPELLYVIGSGSPWDVEERPQNVIAAIPSLLASIDEMERERDRWKARSAETMRVLRAAMDALDAMERENDSARELIMVLRQALDTEADTIAVDPAVPGAERTVTLAAQAAEDAGYDDRHGDGS